HSSPPPNGESGIVNTSLVVQVVWNSRGRRYEPMSTTLPLKLERTMRQAEKVEWMPSRVPAEGRRPSGVFVEGEAETRSEASRSPISQSLAVRSLTSALPREYMPKRQFWSTTPPDTRTPVAAVMPRDSWNGTNVGRRIVPGPTTLQRPI